MEIWSYPDYELFGMQQSHQRRTLIQIQYLILYLLKVISWPFRCRSISHKQFCQYLWQWSWSSGSILYQGLHFSLFNESHISDWINVFCGCMLFPLFVIRVNILVMKIYFSCSEGICLGAGRGWSVHCSVNPSCNNMLHHEIETCVQIKHWKLWQSLTIPVRFGDSKIGT